MASSSRSMPVSSVAAMAIATLSTVAPLTRIPGSAVLPAAMRRATAAPAPPHATPGSSAGQSCPPYRATSASSQPAADSRKAQRVAARVSDKAGIVRV